jgi:branched-chain amino acid aminotransferase
MGMKISIQRREKPKDKPHHSILGFGKHFTDHMFIMDYNEEKSWHDPRIVPYGPISLDPSTAALHYGQAIFEGMKAYITEGNKTLLFRPEKNIKRMNATCERMCIPVLDEDFVLDAIKSFVKYEEHWIPTAPETSLYIRPFIFATDPYLGVKPSSTYKFMIIHSPVGAYYPQGINPVNIYVETKYVRAVPGGTGHIKTSGNYAASLKAQAEAAQKGYIQVLWLDGVERKYIEEVGSMNVFFKIKGEVITPSLEGSILPGVTRDSVIHLLKHEGIPVQERGISIEEVYAASQKGELEEAFGTGTAAVISPIGMLHWEGKNIPVNMGRIGNLSQHLYDTLTGIQFGKLPDKFGWIVEVK